jgi:hypothetical protein
MIGDFPIGIAKDGTIGVALQWDYAAWTSGAVQFTNDVQKLAGNPAKPKKLSWLSLDKFHHGCAKSWRSAV